jgi:hypothetical protein
METLKERGQAARMVDMPVGEDDIRHASQIDLHPFRVFDEHAGIPRVEQNRPLAVLNEVAHGGFGEVVLIDIGAVVHEYGELHRFLPRGCSRLFARA